MEEFKEETLQDKLKWSLDYKLFHFFSVIEKFYNEVEGKVYIGFSGGKDSTLLVHLCDLWCGWMGIEKFPLVFNNTTNEYAEILEFVKTYGDRVTWLRPKMTFAQSLVKNGFPLISKETAQKISEVKTTGSEKLRDIRMNGVVRVSKTTGKKYISGKLAKKWQHLVEADIKLTSKCCDILKKEPVKRFEKESGLFPIIGTTVMESALRKQQYLKTGCNDFTGSRPKSKPLSLFTDENIWSLIEKYSIKVCSIYYDKSIDGEIVKGETRTGCAYCGFGIQFEDPEDTKFHRLQKREPNRCESFMGKLGYRDALQHVGVRIPPRRIIVEGKEDNSSE